MKLRLAIRAVFCTALFSLVAFVAVAAAPPALTRVTTVEGITEYKLANGLKVLLFPDQSKPTITVNITYKVGSRQENYGETGMAHLLEHMMFKGTPQHPDITQGFNARGMRFNGSTFLDRTNFYEMFEANGANLDWALGMEADRMIHSNIARKDLDTEMTVVRNEFERGENSPTNVLIKRMQSISYDWHNYGNATIGNRSDIENVDIRHLQAYYHLYYQPDDAVLLIAGKFDPAKTLQLVTKYFGVIPKPTRQLPKLWTVEPTQDGERSFMVRRAGDLQVVMVGYKMPSALSADVDALQLAAFTLTDTPSGRLHKALVDSGKAAQVGATFLPGLDGTLGIFIAIVKKGDPVEPVKDEMIRQIESFHDKPPTAEEMQRAQTSVANDFERTLNDHEAIGLELSEYIALGDWRMFFLSRDRTAQMTAAQVQEAAGKYLRRDNRVVGVFMPEDHPERAEIPPVPDVAALLKAYHPQETTSVAEAFDPSPDNIDKRTRHLNIDGIRVSLLHKKNRGETVVFSMSLPSGDVKSLFNQDAAQTLTGAMMMRGTTRYTREQLADEFSKLKVDGGVDGQGASFQTTGPNLAAAIRLTAHVLKEPSFPPAEFAQLQKLIVTSLESQQSDPSALASIALAKHFNIYPKGDPRYASSIEESLAEFKATSLDDVKSYYRKFYGADHAQIAIVGDFDEAAVVKAITETLAGWKSGTPWTRITSEYRDIAPVNESIETPDKENATLLAQQNTSLNEDDPDYPALYVANYILGGGAGFDSRLTARIRVKEGLSYGVGSGLSAGRFDRAGAWSAQATAAPQNIAKVETSFKEVVAAFLKDGVTADELAKAKSGIAQRAVQGRAQDGRLVAELLADIDSGRSFKWDKAFETKVQALTPADVLAAARKHIDPAKLTIIKAGDFAKARVAAK